MGGKTKPPTRWVYPDLSDGFWLEETPAVEALYLCGF